MSAAKLPYITLERLFLILLHILHVCSVNVKPQKEHYTPDYRIYHNLSSVALTLDMFCKENSDIIKIIEPTKYISEHGRKQYVIRLTNFAKTELHITERVKVLLSFGEHAREFLPIEALFYLLKTVIKNWRLSDPEIDLNKLDIYIIAIANPDGRHLVEKTKNYCWRGTLSGVDINRNFDWEFGGKGSSIDPTDEEYRGPKAFSEPETHVYRDLTERVHFDGFLSLHSGIKQIYIPYADTISQETGRIPYNVEQMKILAHELSTSTVHKYRYGLAASLNEYTADGTVFDYMAGKRKIPFSYAIELWGPDKHKGPSCFDLFNPPSDQLHAVISDIYPLYVKFFHYLLDWKKRSLSSETKIKDLKDSLQPLGAMQQPQNNDTQNQTTESKDRHPPKFDEKEVAEVYRVMGSKEPHPPEPVHIAQTGGHSLLNSAPPETPGFILLCVLVAVCMMVAVHGKYPMFRRMYQRRRVVNLRALSSTLSINLFSV